MNRLFSKCSFAIKLVLAYVIAIILKILKKEYRNIWIISERGDDARDNGYFFYKYLRDNHKEINAWFVIDSKSADFKKISSIGAWVEHNSWKHFVIYAASVIRISSSMWGGDLPYAAYFQKMHKYMSRKRKFVYLKHGIYKDFDPSSMASIFHPDLFISGAYPEYCHIRDTYGHSGDVVQYTGLARFDSLHDFQCKNQILLMPTFRMWLQGKDEKTVKESEFVRIWNSVLHNSKLQCELEKHGLQLIFYPHYVLQKYVDVFKTNCQNVIIAKFKDYDVQQLLKESKLLVTDFSSVFFDFGYMDKPVIYYQFDRDRYVKEHYDFTKGYFSYDKDGFGEVIYDEQHLVDSICAYIESNFVISKVYQDRIDRFFPLNDRNNCNRIFDKIENLLEARRVC